MELDKETLAIVVSIIIAVMPVLIRYLRRYLSQDYLRLKKDFHDALDTIEAHQQLESIYNEALNDATGKSFKRQARAKAENTIGRKVNEKFYPSRLNHYRQKY